jgi:hypothetical protein
MAADRGSWVPRYLVAIGVTGISTSLMRAIVLSTTKMMSSPYLFAVIATAWFAGPSSRISDARVGGRS